MFSSYYHFSRVDLSVSVKLFDKNGKTLSAAAEDD